MLFKSFPFPICQKMPPRENGTSRAAHASSLRICNFVSPDLQSGLFDYKDFKSLNASLLSGLLFPQRERDIPAACHILPACVGQCRVHGVHRCRPIIALHFLSIASARLIIAYALFLTVVSPVAGGDDRGTE